MTGNRGNLSDFVPAAGDAVEEKEESNGAAGEIKKKLRNVGPDDGFHAAFEGVDDGQRDDNENGEPLRRAENDAHNQRDSRHANAFRNGARNKKR